MRTRRRPAARLVLGLAAVAALATGCSVASPATITTPYAASDGANADLTVAQVGTVKFRNFLLVSAAKGAPGVLVGAVATETGSPVMVQLTLVGADGKPLGRTALTARPGELAQIGPDGTALQISDVPLPPGSVLTLHAQTAGGGTEFQVPVLAPRNQYSSISPTATASTITRTPTRSPSATSPSSTAAASSSGSSTGSAAPTSSPTS